MKLIINDMYHLNGSYFHDDEITEFVQTVSLSRIDPDGTIWAQDEEGDEFEVLKSDLIEIPRCGRKHFK